MQLAENEVAVLTCLTDTTIAAQPAGTHSLSDLEVRLATLTEFENSANHLVTRSTRELNEGHHLVHNKVISSANTAGLHFDEDLTSARLWDTLALFDNN